MSYQIIVALTTEGTTDVRFLENIVQQAFEHVAQECPKNVDILFQTLETTKTSKGSFPEYVVAASHEAFLNGATTIAVHSDADRNTYEKRKEYNFIPAEKAIADKPEEDLCRLITPIIPVRMIEAWMLADKELLKVEIGTRLSDHDLGIDGDPEKMADPKEKISVAIRIANEHATHKNPIRQIDISELYEILGQSLNPEKLKTLESYNLFLEEIRRTYKKLGILH